MDYEKTLTDKITWRIIPFVMVLYTIAYIDRSAVGFAQLHMKTDIGIDAAAYGFGAGLFFLGYFLFEVPSNWILPKVGPRVWFARILVTWGLITALMAFAQGPISFYVLRFLLGAAEAGFYPGILFYLTKWYPQRNRTKATGIFVMAAPLAFLIMSPLAGWLLGINGFGLRGWQWLFIIMGGLAVILAAPTLLLLKDSPRQAAWMSDEESTWLEGELEKDREDLKQIEHGNPFRALLDKHVLMFALLFFPSTVGVYGLSYWLPTVVKRFAGTDLATGWLSAVPYIFALIGILITSRWASTFRENWIPLSTIFGISAVGIFLSAVVTQPWMQLAALSIAAFGLYSIAGVFWALPTRFVIGTSAAIGIAAINSFGNLGGFVGPFVVGAIAQNTGSTQIGMFFLSAVLVLGALGTILVMRMFRGDPGKRSAATVSSSSRV